MDPVRDNNRVDYGADPVTGAPRSANVVTLGGADGSLLSDSASADERLSDEQLAALGTLGQVALHAAQFDQLLGRLDQIVFELRAVKLGLTIATDTQLDQEDL